jgi:hypothetical protein
MKLQRVESALLRKNSIRYRLKKGVRFLMDKGKLLLLRKTRLQAVLRVNAIYDCLDDV